MNIRAAPGKYAINGDTAKSDTVPLTRPGYLWVQTGGTLKYTTTGGDVVTKTVPDAHYEWADVYLLWSTGTAASGIWVHAN